MAQPLTPASGDEKFWLGQAINLAGALAGGAVFNWLGIPAGWLSGAMVAMAILAAFNRAAKLAEPLRIMAMVASGAVIGAGVTPQMLQGFGRYPASIAMMVAAIVLVTASGAALIGRVPGFSRETAFFASVPGALSYVFAVALNTKADMPRVAVVQVLRIFLLMAILPTIVAESGVSVVHPAVGTTDPFWLVGLIFGGSLLAGLALERMGVAGGILFGAMLVSGVLHGSGMAPGKFPVELSIAGQVLVGAWSGSRFVGVDWKLLRMLLPVSLGSFALAALLSVVSAALASWLLGTSFAASVLAFAPGGLEAMTLLSFALGLDPLFVGAHHLARFVLIAFSLPFIARFWLRGAAR